MARNFYKKDGSYYYADTNQKILNTDELKIAAKNGKEVSAPKQTVPQQPATINQPTVTQPLATSPRTLSAQDAPPTPQYDAPQIVDPNIAARRQLEQEAQNLAQTGSALPQTIPQQQAPATDPYSQLTGDMKAMFDALKAQLDALQKKGQVINPNVPITPEKVAEFTKLAEDKINPYYKGQLQMARQGFLRSAGYSTDQLLQNERQLEQQYKTSFRNIGENAAEQGFALSGRRNQAEQNLAGQTQQQLDQARQQLGYNVGNVAGEFAQRYGTSELPAMNIGSAPRVLGSDQGFAQTGGTSPVYNLSPEVYNGLIGSEEYARQNSVNQRVADLGKDFQAQEAIKQQRSLQ